MKWIEVLKAAPVLNRPDFSAVFGDTSGVDISLDANGHPQAYEFVALPRQNFPIVCQISSTIYQIEALDYASYPLYIDIRFCQVVDCPQEKQRPIFSALQLLQHMEKRVGTPYVWGGNWADGIAEMLVYYPPSGSLLPRIEEIWTFRGLDCSGLLFEASQGFTPRNSSALVTFGSPLESSDLRPMDMIVYPGHVLFVRDQETIIESKSPLGVRIAPLQKRLAEIRSEKKFVHCWESEINTADSFTIRRFCAE